MKIPLIAKALVVSAVVAASTGLAAFPAEAKAAKNKPNVLLFVTDDTGMDQVTLYGYPSTPEAAATPNLASLQNIGLTFRNAWTMPACSTARGVLYTGRYPFRTDLQGALGPDDLANSMISPYLKTAPRLLSKAGYATGLFGKFHVGLVGNNPYGNAMVNAVGWQHFEGWLDETGDPSSIDTTAGGVAPKGTYPNGYVPGTQTSLGVTIDNGADSGACYSANGQCQPMSTSIGALNPAGRMCRDQGGIFVPNQPCEAHVPSNLNFQTLSAHYVSPLVVSEGGLATAVPPTDTRARTFRNVAQTDAAINWINKQQQRGKPWFATITTSTVHTPLQVPPIDTLPPGSPDSNDVDVSTTQGADLVANQMIQAADYEFGRLLTSTGLAVQVDGNLILTARGSNTIVIYLNDNGSLGGQVRLPFDPNRAKGTSYQTGVWTPMIIAGARVNPSNAGKDVEALVDVADVYELIGNVAGIDVRKNNPYRIDSVAMIQYLADNEAPSLRRYDFNFAGPNLQANNGINGPCQFPGTNGGALCSQIPVTRSVCEDNGGVWFGENNGGTYTTASADNPGQSVTMSIPTSGFRYCCQVQQYIVNHGGFAGSVFPTTSMAAIDTTGYKLVRNKWNSYDPASPTGCREVVQNELYIVAQHNNLSPDAPLLDTEQREIRVFTPEDTAKYNELTTYLDNLLGSEPECLSKGDGNDDGVVNLVDLANYKKMKKITSGSSWYDVNTDGTTDEADQQIITQHLGLNCKNQ